MSKNAEKTAHSRIHVALNTPRFEESVRFYRAFFGREPVKLKPGYAKFDVTEPPVNLTLNAVESDTGPATPAGALNHLGVEVRSTEAVKEATARLRAAGLATLEEENTDCCYALQDKVWVTDPNGYRWEVFVVKVGDTRPELSLEAGKGESCCASTCCSAPLEGATEPA